MFCLVGMSVGAYSQDFKNITDSLNVEDSTLTTSPVVDTNVVVIPDSIILVKDTTAKVLKVKPPGEEKLKSKVEYSARDSIRFEVEKKKIYLYGDAKINYESTNVQAGYIEIDWVTNEIIALPLIDSLGKETELPVMVDNGQSYNSHSLVYNFDSKKGRIKQVITSQGDGKLHGEVVKKIDEKSMFIKNGKFSTCLDDDPHFYIQSNKLKVIQNDKIVTGPAYFAFEKVPSPLVVPFGFFPNTQKQKSGLILPAPGQSADQGFFFRNIGYFIAISEKITMQVNADLYTKGSFGLRVGTQYKKRYKYYGSLDLSHNTFITSSKELPDYRVTRNYFVKWKHVQDIKARPNSNFSGEINAGTNTSFTRNVSAVSNVQNFLTNTFKSNISYSKTFVGTPFNLILNATHDQNTQTKIINVTLPQLQVNMQRIFPFARKEVIGSQKWYEKVGLNYTFNARNTYSAADSVFLNKNNIKKMSYGIQHNASMSTNFKVMKYFTLTPSINANSRFDFKSIDKHYEILTDSTGVQRDTLITDTIQGFFPNADVSGNLALTTVVYGMYRFKGRVEALRHTMTPSLSFNYRPDLTLTQTTRSTLTGTENKYNRHDIGTYGAPPKGKQGALNFSLMNNIEMKVKPGKKDTATASRKIKLLDQLGLTGGYNLLADSNRLSDIAMRAVTTIFNGRVGINYSMNWSPYTVDSNGTLTRFYTIDREKKLLRFKTASLAMTFNLNKSTATKKPRQSKYGTEDELAYINAHPDEFLDFNIPWNVSLGYNINYSKNFKKTLTDAEKKNQMTMALSLSGDFSITPKWKIQVTSGYDFANKKMSTTSVNIYRDLHCWEIKLNWIPFGQQQSYQITIQPKAGLLQDLKITRTRSWFDR